MAKKIGVALGCGGARGFAHIGVLKVLQKADIKIDLIVGASMGSIIGSLFALGYSLEEIEKEALSFNKKKMRKTFFDLASPKKSLIKGKRTEEYIKKLIKNKTFKSAKVPLYITATDLSSGDQVVIDKGKISDAIMASISVPGIFPPVKREDKFLVDGGISNPTPVDVVKKKKAEIIIGVDLVKKKTTEIKELTLMSTLIQSYEIMRTQAMKLNLNKIEKKVIMIEPELRGPIQSFKFYNIEKFIKEGERAAKKALPKIKRQLNK